MSKIKLDRDIKVNGHLFEKGNRVDTQVDGTDYADILKDIMKNTTVEQAEAVAHQGEQSPESNN